MPAVAHPQPARSLCVNQNDSDHTYNCPSSPKGGLCKAWKEMKSKVATHTGMSLSFVELVATLPVVGLLPALPPSPRSPSSLLHRHINLPGNFSFMPRRSSSTEQSPCVDMENAGRQGPCNAELEPAQTSCALASVNEDTRPGIKLPSVYGLLTSCACSSTCKRLPSSTSFSCDSLCGQPSSSSCIGDPSSSTSSVYASSAALCHVSCGHISSCSSCDLQPSSCSFTCSWSSGQPAVSSPYALSCPSTCGVSCAGQSSSSLSSSGDSSCVPQSASSSSLSSSSCCLSSGHLLSLADESAKLVSDMHPPNAQTLLCNNVDLYCAPCPGISKHATTVSQAKFQIGSSSTGVICFIATLIFALSSISKKCYYVFLWVSRYVLHKDTLLHYIRAIISAGYVQTKSKKLPGVEGDGCGNEVEGLKGDVSVVPQSLQYSKMSCVKRSKLLKTKLRSSFKSLYVQVPRKASAPLHLNTFSRSSFSSSSSSSSPSSSSSHAVNNTPTARSAWIFKSQAFVWKITKSLNHKQTVTISQTSPVPPECRMCGGVPTSDMVSPHPSSCGWKQGSPKRATSLNRLGDSIVVPLVAVPLALCALFYGKCVAFIAVTAWLVVVCIVSSVYFLFRIFCNWR